MPAFKKHHYVPKMYMRLFGGDDDRVGVFVLETGKFVPAAPIGGHAFKDYFYGKDPSTELALGRLENKVAPVLRELAGGGRPPSVGSELHELLMFFLGVQHSRTMSAATHHDEAIDKSAKMVLSRKAELEGNRIILDALDSVTITRSHGVSEVIGYATIAAGLLTDLALTIIENDTEIPFITSDSPVVLHNTLYEGQHIAATGWANVGLQMLLPLGPHRALFAYDADAYRISEDDVGIIKQAHAADIQLINDLQWEAAHKILLVAKGTCPAMLAECAATAARLRRSEHVFVDEEIVNRTGDEVRTRMGSGEAPSSIILDLSFASLLLPAPAELGRWQIPPFRDLERVRRVDSAFAALDEITRSAM